MGADLYLDSEYEPNRQKWEPLFIHWVSVRDNLMNAGMLEDVSEAQGKVERYCQKMISKGHYRDAYNDSNLLWKFGLSWWMDMDRFITKGGNTGGVLTPQKAKELLATLAGLEKTFKANVEGDKDRKYFESKYKRFKKFLKSAIEKKENITCSV